MKKKLIFILIGLFILIGGYLMIGEYKKIQLVKEAQKKAEDIVYRNYEGIKKVTINKEYYKITPMGGLSVGGHVNDDKSLTFNIGFQIEKDGLGKATSIFIPNDFPTEKKECENKICQ
ncbi:hypothetical protein H1Z61_01905 [Bacillus aquiflavi]|uniref:DUF1433 domain-containing protein n=1 Tax=Bacillus aquiflavi TaxID=2672567 RepID=A0A6B3VPR7_9BACI|nr:hypothetical protein [Bacillus aquiflavi]MBA4535925.1 hypothetical protein [Bacillus aquiflavi]NEY80300.1 hypothetical protein [Bacillus aquiflavi]